MPILLNAFVVFSVLTMCGRINWLSITFGVYFMCYFIILSTLHYWSQIV